jgi:murein DD-endopeptidase MepM/ murein hydrolase activator NlpD
MFVPTSQRRALIGAAGSTVAGMPRNVLALLVVAVLSVVLEGAGPPAAMAAEHWRRPLPGGAVVGSFSFEQSSPYARGRRRGVDIAGKPGARVLAVCAGLVTHAGRVPGFGRGVSVRCGRLVATQLGLGAVAATRGERVVAGAVLGRLASGGVLRLGARVATRRHGYLDPLTLIQDARPAPPAVAPRPPAVKRPRRRPAAPTAPAPEAAPAPSTSAVPWPVLAGLGLLAAGAGSGSIVRSRHRRRTRTGMALAQR